MVVSIHVFGSDPFASRGQFRSAFSREDFDRVTNELAQRFDGVTAYVRAPAEGVWKQDQKLSSDDIVVLEVITEKVDLAEWSERRQQYENGFRQEKVIVRYMAISLA